MGESAAAERRGRQEAAREAGPLLGYHNTVPLRRTPRNRPAVDGEPVSAQEMTCWVSLGVFAGETTPQAGASDCQKAEGECQMLYVPSVIEQTPRGERSWDLFSRLLQSRIVFIGSEINDIVANIVMGQLLYLQNEDPGKDVRMYINTPGGDVLAGLAIYDTIQLIAPDVETYCVGKALSMGAILLAGGAKGKRFALPNSRVMMHQPLGGAYGPATDVDIFTREMLRTRDRINEILAYHTGQAVETIKSDTERDRWMTAEEAKDYGIVDEVLSLPGVVPQDIK